MRTDLIWRGVLPAAAVIASFVGGPRAVAGGLVLFALVLAVDRLVVLRDLGPADRVLVGVGGVLVALVLTGLVLGSTPIGLDSRSWVVGLAVVSEAGIAVAALLPHRRGSEPASGTSGATGRRASRLTALLVLPWIAAGVVVVAVAVNQSASSLSTADAAPLQMSFGRVSGTHVQVVVSDSAGLGPLEVRTAAVGDDAADADDADDAGTNDEVSYPLFTLPAGGTRTTTVSLPTSGRFVISLGYPDQTQPLRTLVIDR